MDDKLIEFGIKLSEADVNERGEATPLAKFLENTPPLTIEEIDVSLTGHRDSERATIKLPEIQVYCPSERCENRKQVYRSIHDTEIIYKLDGIRQSWERQYMTFSYACGNCRSETKMFSFSYYVSDNRKVLVMRKMGEFPPFGPPTPSLLLKIVGSEREYFLKGRRCEAQGLGIAAFAYYRRIVENQKNKIFDQIIKVVEKTVDDDELIKELKEAKKEKQFTKSMNHIKRALPQSMLINGHNPLQLLHRALSEGLHGHTDKECLEYAQSIRVILSTLAEKMQSAFNEDKDVQAALKLILKNNK